MRKFYWLCSLFCFMVDFGGYLPYFETNLTHNQTIEIIRRKL